MLGMQNQEGFHLQENEQEEVPIFDEDAWIDENNVVQSEKSIPET